MNFVLYMLKYIKYIIYNREGFQGGPTDKEPAC